MLAEFVSPPRHLDPEVLYRELRRALRHGARAARLVRFTPELVELLFPAALNPGHELVERAVWTERRLREAIEQIGGAQAAALAVVLGLAPGTVGLKLERRRETAGKLLGVLPDTFRRDQHEGLLLWDLAVEIYALLLRDDIT